MKIRNGFVSNSSSSSFIIVFKTNKKLDEIQLPKFLKSDFKKLDEEIDYHIKHIIFDCVESGEQPIPIEQYIQMVYGYDTIEQYYKIKNKKDLKKIKDDISIWYSKNYKICYGSFKSYSEGGREIETILSEIAFDIEMDDYIFRNEGSY